LAAQGGLQGGGHNHFNKETTLRTMSRLAVALIAALSVVWLAAAAWGAVTATVTPNSGLHDQDAVHVQATGLPANTVIAVVECTSTATSSADCEGSTADVTTSTNASGAYDNPSYTVLQLPDSIFPTTSITCDSTHPCSLYVGTDFNDFSAPHTLVPISFAAPASTTTTTIGTPVPEVAKAILLPLSTLGLLGGGFVVAARRRRRVAGAAK
jgi:hypothetical protein